MQDTVQTFMPVNLQSDTQAMWQEALIVGTVSSLSFYCVTGRNRRGIFCIHVDTHRGQSLIEPISIWDAIARGVVIARSFVDPFQDAKRAKTYQGAVPLLRPVQRRIAPKDSILLGELDASR
jgi:hypothetical protein